MPRRNVLEEPLPWLDDIVRAQRPERLPVVLTIDEVRQVLDLLNAPRHSFATHLLERTTPGPCRSRWATGTFRPQ